MSANIDPRFGGFSILLTQPRDKGRPGVPRYIDTYIYHTFIRNPCNTFTIKFVHRDAGERRRMMFGIDYKDFGCLHSKIFTVHPNFQNVYPVHSVHLVYHVF